MQPIQPSQVLQKSGFTSDDFSQLSTVSCETMNLFSEKVARLIRQNVVEKDPIIQLAKLNFIELRKFLTERPENRTSARMFELIEEANLITKSLSTLQKVRFTNEDFSQLASENPDSCKTIQQLSTRVVHLIRERVVAKAPLMQLARLSSIKLREFIMQNPENRTLETLSQLIEEAGLSQPPQALQEAGFTNEDLDELFDENSNSCYILKNYAETVARLICEDRVEKSDIWKLATIDVAKLEKFLQKSPEEQTQQTISQLFSQAQIKKLEERCMMDFTEDFGIDAGEISE